MATSSNGPHVYPCARRRGGARLRVTAQMSRFIDRPTFQRLIEVAGDRNARNELLPVGFRNVG